MKTATATLPKTELTKRQQKVFDFIWKHIEKEGWPPTVREIGKAMGIRSPNGVISHLKALIKKKKIEMKASNSRSIRIAGHRIQIVPIDGE